MGKTYYAHHFAPVTGKTDLTQAEWQRMSGLLETMRPAVYVEVGVGRLGTLRLVATFGEARGIACTNYGIDAFGELPPDGNGENSHEGDVVRLSEAKAYLHEHNLEELCHLHQGDSSQVLRRLLPRLVARPLLVFIDGNHTYAGCRADFEAIRPHLRPGDVVVLHDTQCYQHPDYGRGPRGVVEDLIESDPKLEVVYTPPASIEKMDPTDTITVVQCRADGSDSAAQEAPVASGLRNKGV